MSVKGIRIHTPGKCYYLVVNKRMVHVKRAEEQIHTQQ